MFDYFLGIDVAKDKFSYAVINNKLKTIYGCSFDMIILCNKLVRILYAVLTKKALSHMPEPS